MRYFIALMIFFTSFSYADVYGSIGYADPLNKGTGTSRGAALHVGWEENLSEVRSWYDMPWVVSGEYFSDRDRQNTVLNEHYSISAGKQLFKPCWGDFCLYGDLGLALHSEVTDVNSSRVTAYEHLGVTYKQVRLYFRHTSNAGLRGRNVGENSIFIGYTF